jgi:hypothetical protein
MTEIQEWTNEFELSDEDKQTLSNKGYDSPLKALQGGAATIRMSGSPERTLKNLETLDLEKLDDKQKESLNTSIRKIRGVPDSPEGYNIPRPDFLPEGMKWDADLENWFRKEVHAKGGSNELVNHLVTNWTKRQLESHENMERIAKESEEKLLEEMGKEKFEAAFGKEGDPNAIGNVKRCLLAASKELGLDYKDENGFPQSHLLDCLELSRKDGQLGNRAPLAKFVNWVWNKFMAEGSTEGGRAPGGHKDPDKERIEQNKKDFPYSPWMWT